MKKAFTMIELIFIIVVVGILAAVAVPQINRNSLVEAADQVAAHIRYTQQLAMNDNKFDPNDPNWFKRLWRIQFHVASGGAGSPNDLRYTVFFDSTPVPSGNPNSLNDIAIDPQNPNKFLTSGFSDQPFNAQADRMNKKMNLTKTYNIRNIQFANCGNGNNQTISFDSYGRPMGQLVNSNVPYDRMFVTPCVITLTNDAGETALITIQPETGYVNYTLASNTGPGGQ